MKHKHHIIPRHIGGSDDPSNLIELTMEEHAEAHHILWEQHGRYQDYYAWQGLSGTIGKEHIHKAIMNEPSLVNHLSKKSKEYWINLDAEKRKERIDKFNLSKIGNKNALGKPWILSEQSKKNVAAAKSQYWYITDPNGYTQIIKNMNLFCKENDLDQGAMSNVSKGKNKHHKGYTCIRMDN